jgi:predicted RND superfamily exporter protein
MAGAMLAPAGLAFVSVDARAAVTAVAPQTEPRATTQATGTSLESAAAKASSTGRAVAMSLIGLAFAVAATVLAFRRDFKEAAGVFAVGIVSVLLATPAGVSLLRDTVTSLFGAS